jgi:hypothetical protein
MSTERLQVSTAEVNRERMHRRHALERHLADSSAAMQRHKPGSHMHAVVAEDRQRTLERLARLDRTSDSDLRDEIAAREDPARTAAVESVKRNMNTPEARTAARQAIWQQIEEKSAGYQERMALEQEVQAARAAAADEAERRIRERYASDHAIP